MPRSILLHSLLTITFLLLPTSGWGEDRPGARPATVDSATSDSLAAPGLDQAAVQALYVEGEFDSVLARIQEFRQNRPEHSRADSLFIARHLAVVLAADPNSVEAGKYWMHRLLLLSPEADLEGMFVSESIEDIFRRVKREARIRPGGSRLKWLWLGAGGTALTAGIAAWLLLSQGSDGPTRTVVPVTL
jgi:hypothetical protein